MQTSKLTLAIILLLAWTVILILWSISEPRKKRATWTGFTYARHDGEVMFAEVLLPSYLNMSMRPVTNGKHRIEVWRNAGEDPAEDITLSEIRIRHWLKPTEDTVWTVTKERGE